MRDPMASSPLTLLRAEGGSIDTIRPTPQSPALGGLADVLEYLRTAGNSKTILPPDSWLAGKFGGAGRIGDLLFGKSPEEVREWSYGNAPMRLPPAGTGGYVPDFKRSLAVDEATGNRKPGNERSSRSDSLADTLFAAQPALPLAKAAGRAGARGGLQAIQAGMSGSGPLRGVLAPVAPAYAVRPRGGNFGPEGVDNYLHEGLGLTGAPGPTADWAKKQLRNYITKDMGSPSDPLLQLEKELPGLHLPEGTLEAAAENAQRVNRMPEELLKSWLSPQAKGQTADYAKRAAQHRSFSSEPLTPWGVHSDNALTSSTVGEEMGHWNPEAVPEWMKKADPSTPYYGLETEGDVLGFRHVLDYLDAAQAAHKNVAQYGDVNVMRGAGAALHPDYQRALGLHDAGLMLSPEQVARTSVADAVRKTAQWNKFMAEQGVDAAPGLAKGIAAVHKEYPEEGMKWVKLGLSEGQDLPPDAKLVHYPSGREGALDPREAWTVDGPHGFGQLHNSKESAQQAYLKNMKEAELKAGLNAEGDAMGHCVGGYCEDVASRGTEIYSLRDAKGNPHVTVEVRPNTKGFGDWVANMPGDMKQAYMTQFEEKFGRAPDLAGRRPDEQWVNYLKELRGAAPDPMDILQIKGKQNAAPVDKYLPFVQDFVKSGQWGRVGDLGNTGLVQFNGGKTNIRHSADHTYTGLEMPKGYMTPEEASQHLQAQGVPAPIADQHVGNYKGAKGPRLEFAQGGSVVPKFSKKAALLARLNPR